ncbi:MAG: 1-acyl-sn-glycerol-3-phosphate acyltransferase [Candidatus Omnitrophica bacterium]|nr:1-acyl-sn-glycerol-3-phosphate acyltransferase [Candidatus Omnitrophota bacterium]
MWYYIFCAIFRVFFKTFYKFEVEGLENIPQKTNFIIVANHASFLDPLIIMAAVPKKIYCLVARYLYGIAFIKWFLLKVEALPTGNASDKAVRLLLKNKNVGLYPEGKLSTDGSLGEFRRGAALLAAKTGRPILPCAILGAYKALPFGARFAKFFLPIKVKIGKPVFILKEFGEVINDIYLQEGTLKTKNTIKELINAG